MKKSDKPPEILLEPVRICATCRNFKVVEDVPGPPGRLEMSYMISSCAIHGWRNKEYYLQELEREISVDLSDPCPDWAPLPGRVGARELDAAVAGRTGLSLRRSAKVRRALIEEWTLILVRQRRLNIPGFGTIVADPEKPGRFRVEREP